MNEEDSLFLVSVPHLQQRKAGMSAKKDDLESSKYDKHSFLFMTLFRLSKGQPQYLEQQIRCFTSPVITSH